MNNSLPKAVHEIDKIHFEGNIIPHKWFQHLKMPSANADAIGALLLADIVYWYRPTKEIDKATGKLLSSYKKFKADMLQASASYYQSKFGFTKKQVRDALKRLEDNGYIKREYRTIKTKDGIALNNVMFIEPIPTKIMEITHSNTLSPQSDTLSPQGDRVSRQSETYTEITTEITTKNTTNIRPTEKNESESGFQNVGKVGSSILNGIKNGHKKTTDLPKTVESEPVSSGLVFDFAFKDWTNIQKQRAIKALNGVPESDKQMVLDELNSAVAKGTVKQIWRYLNTLVKKYQASEFVPTSDLFEQRSKPVDKGGPCIYCKDTGKIQFKRSDGTMTLPISCKHGDKARAYIDMVKRDYRYDLKE